jgi:hypothetical protein
MKEQKKEQENAEERKRAILAQLREKVDIAVQVKSMEQKSIVEKHMIQMEKFGIKNGMAEEKIQALKQRDAEVKA